MENQGNTNPQTIAVFRSPERAAEYERAYAEAMKLWPVPYEDVFVPTRFGETHVVVSGPADAPALVLFHGTGGGATIWYRNVAAFSRRFRVYAVDTLTESNRSRPTRRLNNRRELAEWAAALLDGLGIGKAYLVGNSFGGFLALNTAFFYPQRVEKVALLSPAATFDPMWALWLRLLVPAHVIAPAIHAPWMVDRAYDWLWQGFPKDEYMARLRSLTSHDGMPRHCPPVVFSDAELRQIRTPVLLLIGDREVIYPVERVIRRARRLVAGLEAAVLPNANHNTQYTAPEEVNRRVLEFFLRE